MVERPHLLKGREHPIDGPTRTVVPLRVLCPPRQSGSDLMQALTADDAIMREFEQTGLHSIRRTGENGSAACGFQTVLVVTADDASQAPGSRLHRAISGPDRFVPLQRSCSVAQLPDGRKVGVTAARNMTGA